MAQMAQQQAKIREAIREMNNELNKDGKNSMGNLDSCKRIWEKTETELVEQALTDEMKMRHTGKL
jgi:hypothetical protein